MTAERWTYRKAGVDIAAGNEAVRRLAPLAAATRRPGVLGGIGGFGGLFALSPRLKRPVLVASTDGVGTKLKIAFALDRHDTVGIDLVAMSVNDILVQGAEPLFFLDYIACGKLLPGRIADLVKGIAEGCLQAGCALLGGETAEMPGFYKPGEYCSACPRADCTATATALRARSSRPAGARAPGGARFPATGGASARLFWRRRGSTSSRCSVCSSATPSAASCT